MQRKLQEISNTAKSVEIDIKDALVVPKTLRIVRETLYMIHSMNCLSSFLSSVPVLFECSPTLVLFNSNASFSLVSFYSDSTVVLL